MKKIYKSIIVVFIIICISACGSTDNKTNDENIIEDTDIGDEDAANIKDNKKEYPRLIKDALLKEMGERYWPDSEISEEMLNKIYGISPDLYDSYFGEMPMITVKIDTLIIIKAKNDKVGEVENALNEYRDKLVNDALQYPVNMKKIQASQVETIDDYVCFVMLGADVIDDIEMSEEEMIKECMEENDKAIEIIKSVIKQFGE